MLTPVGKMDGSEGAERVTTLRDLNGGLAEARALMIGRPTLPVACQVLELLCSSAERAGERGDLRLRQRLKESVVPF